MDKLMTEFDYTLEMNTGTGLSVSLVRFSDGAIKLFPMGLTVTADNAKAVAKNLMAHMHSLTDELCQQFFPDAKVKNQKEVKVAKAPDLENVKNLRVADGKYFLGKKGKFEELTKEQFHAELVRRYGEPSANKWLEEQTA